jgi:hypothetical protein
MPSRIRLHPPPLACLIHGYQGKGPVLEPTKTQPEFRRQAPTFHKSSPPLYAAYTMGVTFEFSEFRNLMTSGRRCT